MSSLQAMRGTLYRTESGWEWRDGTPEPRVTDRVLGELAWPLKRATKWTGTYVEIPVGWRTYRNLHPALVEAVEQLTREHPRSVRSRGYRVPIAAWDSAMSRVIGATWAKEDEPAILARVRELAGES